MRIPPGFIARAVVCLHSFWTSLIRYRVLFMEPVWQLKEQGALFAFALWHDEMFNMARIRHGFDIVGLVSQSKDGEILAKIMENLGAATARGSSSRGGVKALVQTCRLMRKERRHAVITIDGPRGPRHQAKDGILLIAQRAPALIVPVRAYMTRKIIFRKAWDRFQLPLPGARVIIAFGKPYSLDCEELNAENLERERQRLEQGMASVDERVVEALSLSPTECRRYGLNPTNIQEQSTE